MHFRIVLFFVALFLLPCISNAQDKPITYQNQGIPLGFSPDNRYIAVAVGDSVEVWDVKSTSIAGKFFGYSGQRFSNQLYIAWSPDGNRFLVQGGSISNGLAAVSDLRTGKTLKLAPADNQSGLYGFYDNATLWGVASKNQKIETYPLDFSDTEYNKPLRADWSAPLPAELREIYLDPAAKLFYPVVTSAEGYRVFAGTLKKGETALGAFPANLQKKLSKAICSKSSSGRYLVLRTKKKGSYELFDLAAQTISPLFTETSYNGDYEFFNAEMVIDFHHSNMMGYLSANSMATGMPVEMPQISGQVLDACIMSEDLGWAAVLELIKPGNTLLSVYNLKNKAAPAIAFARPRPPALEKFNQYVKSHTEAYAAYKKEYIERMRNEGWELVRNNRPGAGGYVSEYNFYLGTAATHKVVRFGYDLLAASENRGDVIPEGMDCSTSLTIDGESTSSHMFRTKVIEHSIRQSAEFCMRTNISVDIHLALRHTLTDYDHAVPPETYEMLVFRRISTAATCSPEIVMDDLAVKIEQSTFNTDPCASKLMPLEALDAMQRFDDVLSKQEHTLKAIHGAYNLQTRFYSPEITGSITIVVFTSGPCNVLNVYDESRSDLPSKLVITAKPDLDMIQSAEDRKKMADYASKGIYFISVKIPCSASNRGTYGVYLKGEYGEAKGASFIHVSY